MDGLPEPGDKLGEDFVLEEEIGRGGMGVVFKAHQLSARATRAVKVPLPELARDPDYCARFQREAQATGMLESDYLVKVVQHALDPRTGIPFIAMEYLEGSTLAEHVRREGPLAGDRALLVFRQMFHGVSAAHDAGIVHRDLKPANVHLSRVHRVDATFAVKILDFGIARELTPSSGSAVADARGTRLWMAPEQERRDAALTTAADVWALGLVVFFALTGRSYFRSAGASPAELRAEVLFGALPKASERFAELGVPSLGPDFDVWFSRVVQRDPERRVQTAGESWKLLEPILASRNEGITETSADTESFDVPTTGRARLRWTLASLAGTAFVIAVALAQRCQ